MSLLIDIMDDRALTGMLVSMRLKLATRRHTEHFFRSLSGDAPDPKRISSFLDTVLPPRRTWARPDRETRATMAPDTVDRRALMNSTLRGLRAMGTLAPWAIELRDLLDLTRCRAGTPREVALTPPRPIPIAKKKDKYRVVAPYEVLSDRLLLGMTAKYLAHLLDPIFSDSSHAFRVSRHFSRNVAVKRIQDYVIGRRGQPVFVAECDIQSFYDTVDHQVVKVALSQCIDQLRDRGEEIDPCVAEIVDMYLGSYDYLQYGRPAALAVLASKSKTGEVGLTPEKIAELRPDGVVGRVGLPQGGALSPVLANLVLDAADKMVIGEGGDPDLLYLRYCDDMVILHTDPNRCSEALNRYTGKLRELLLPVHPPEKIVSYDKSFYEAKTKLPYRLADPSGGAGRSPWMSFLGYQIRYDGQLRVKQESLTRHMNKQASLAAKAMRLAMRPRAQLLKNNQDIINKVALRLVASSVGKRAGTQPTDTARNWMDAFKLLKRNSYSERQMRRLDQYRDHLLRRLGCILQARHPENKAPITLTGSGKAKWRLPFLGRSLSYCGKLIGDSLGAVRQRFSHDKGYGEHY
jgi:hypothetical protein